MMETAVGSLERTGGRLPSAEVMGSSREAEGRQSAAPATAQLVPAAVFLHVTYQRIFDLASTPEPDEAQTAAQANKGSKVIYKATNEGDASGA